MGTLVAVGACFVAQTFSGVTTEIEPAEKFEDIISHSLGVEVLAQDGATKVLSKIIFKGDVYPCQKTKLYTTTMDNQTTIPIYIYEAGADSENIADIDAHEFYGDLSLEIEDTAPAGVPVIKVTFGYDKSGTLEVTARDEKSGVNKTVTIKKGIR